MGKVVEPKIAIAQIKSGSRIFIQGGVATPQALIEALVEDADRLTDVELMHLHTEGKPLYADAKYAKSFRVVNLFVGTNMRHYVDLDRVDYLPCFLSEIPSLFRKGVRKPDVAFIHVSPPDAHGYCSLGTSVDVTRSAIETASLVVAQVNPRMPRVHGDGIIHIDKINYMIEVDIPLIEVKPRPLSEADKKIGQFAAGLIEDGATLQMGIGTIPDAVLSCLHNHKNLGIHTEMWSDGALDLILSGAVNNSLKKIHPGKTVSAFVTGTKRLYDFIHDNVSVQQLEVSYVNNPQVIARNKKVVAINSAVEIDLTGQVCADSVGSQIISGVGGQVDFIRGASLSEGGKPIMAMTSRTSRGIPRVVTQLKKGAGVVTTRAHVHYVVTEYGVAEMFGKTLGERARALISIAHPDDRELLERQWHELNR